MARVPPSEEKEFLDVFLPEASLKKKPRPWKRVRSSGRMPKASGIGELPREFGSLATVEDKLP
jgi:hypothetical protein